MNLGQLHAYFGSLLDAGVDPSLPVVSLVAGWPQEVSDVVRLIGKFDGDPAPKMSAFKPMEGTMLALVPIGEDQSMLLNPGEGEKPASHQEEELPVEPPYPE